MPFQILRYSDLIFYALKYLIGFFKTLFESMIFHFSEAWKIYRILSIKVRIVLELT